MGHPKRTTASRPGRRTGRRPFLLRWFAATSIAMVIAGAAEYALGVHETESIALREATQVYAAEVTGLEEALTSGSPGAERDAAVAAELTDIAEIYGTVDVALYRADGSEVVHREGMAGTDPAKLVTVLQTGEPVSGKEADEGETDEADRYEFLLPVESTQGRLVLQVDQRAEVIGATLTALRERKIVGLAIALLLGVPLSYLLGGRALHRDQRRAHRAADTDALTGLAGRRPFVPDLEAALSGPGAERVVLAVLDIDDFKRVNDGLGHSYGDRVLVALAESFGELRSTDTAYRLGGDEFAVVLRGATEATADEAVARVRGALTDRMPGITFSSGIASAAPENGLSVQELSERADAALYEAKSRGRRRTVCFGSMSEGLTVSHGKREAVAALLERGSGISVAFQPIWDLGAKQVLGHEALLRLPPGSPLDGPQEAFDVAQRLGLADRLDERARAAVIHAVGEREWHGLLFINIHPEALAGLEVDELVEQLHTARLRPQDVVLEVTEHAGLDRLEPLRTLKRATARGFRLALDDLGQGNAGLRALTQVRFDVVKIDREVIARLGTDPASDATVAAATAFIHRTGGWVVAEGVEDPSIFDQVMEIGRVPRSEARIAGQGYLLGRPAPEPLVDGTSLPVAESVAVD